MSEPIRVIHYLNQFFGGIGGEDKANAPPELRRGPVGPGRLLQAALGDAGNVAATLICGDNFFVDEEERASSELTKALQAEKPHLLIAGPTFDAGRYGYACAKVSRLARSMNIPAVTGMHRDNPGYTTFRRYFICVPTGSSSREMQDAMARMAGIGLRLAAGESLGPAAEEGYLPTGVRRHRLREKPAWQRAIEMLEARLNGQAWSSEVALQQYADMPVRPKPRDASQIKLGLVTSGGLVPKDNPDGQVSGYADRAFRYSIYGLDRLNVEEWQSVHGGFNTVYLNTKSPDYVLPLPALRSMERAGRIGSIHPTFFSTVGNGTSVSSARQMGMDIAKEFASCEVEAALLVAT